MGASRAWNAVGIRGGRIEVPASNAEIHVFPARPVESRAIAPVVIQPQTQIEGGNQTAIDDDGTREVEHWRRLATVRLPGNLFRVGASRFHRKRAE